jgi:hypothetical protein
VANDVPWPEGFTQSGRDFTIIRQLDHRRGSNINTPGNQFLDCPSWTRQVTPEQADLSGCYDDSI